MLHSLDVEPGDLGSTVRKGLKWAETEGVSLVLCVCSDRCRDAYLCDNPAAPSCSVCDRQGRAVVVACWYGAMRDVPARLIECEHEERSRQYSGLLASMRKAYGPEFSEDETVTVLVYRRTS